MILELTTPSLLRRMACWLYDSLLLSSVFLIATYLFSALTQSRHALENRDGLQVFLFLVVSIYSTWFGYKGQTLAMKTWHIRLLNAKGKALTQKQAFVRYLFSWIWVIPPLALRAIYPLTNGETAVLFIGWITVWALLSYLQSQHQFWHDVWAGTRLVDTRPTKKTDTN